MPRLPPKPALAILTSIADTLPSSRNIQTFSIPVSENIQSIISANPFRLHRLARVDQTGRPSIISNSRGDQTTPSVVYVPKSGPPLIGQDAIDQGFLYPERCFRNFKLLLGSTESLSSHGKAFTPTDATALLIGQIKQDAEVAMNMEVTKVLATCPANWKDNQKQALIEAFERNGLEVIELMAEPTAAGFAHAFDKQGTTITFVVFDFGGGTFDVSVVRLDNSAVVVLATEGVPKLGGNDINDLIQEAILDDIEAKFDHRPNRQDDPLLS